MSEKKKILLLPVSSGTGHLQVAKALMEVMEKNEKIIVESIDLLEVGNSLMRIAYRDMYAEATQNVPELYSYMYRNFNVEQRFRKFQQFFDRVSSVPIFQKIETFKPDLVLSLHPLSIEVIDFWRKLRGHSFQHCSIVTDFEGHGQWVNYRVDQYFVGSELTRQYLMEMGISETAIEITGIPIMQKFEREISKKEAKSIFSALMQEEYERIPKSDKRWQKPVVLFVAGSLTSSEAELVGQRIFRQKEAIYIVITGRNTEVYQVFGDILKKEAPYMPVKLMGFANNMEELMSVGRIIISKPGGLTASEAMRKELPIVVIKPIPGQEQENSDYILENGLGVRVNNLELLHYKVKKLVQAKNFKEIKRRCRHFSFKNSSQNVADKIVNMLQNKISL